MTRLRAPRLVGLVLSLGLTACADGGGDSHALETWAEGVAAIPIVSEPSYPAARSERSRLVVEVVDRWRLPSDAAGLRGLAELALPSDPEVEPEVLTALQPSTAAAVVQLAAFRTEKDAEDAWKRLAADHAAVFAGARPRFETVELPSGRWVRLKVAAPDRARAAEYCLVAAADSRWCEKTAG